MNTETEHTKTTIAKADNTMTTTNTMHMSTISSLRWITLLLMSSVASGLNVQSRSQVRLRSPGSSIMSDSTNFNGQIMRTPPKTKLLYAHGDYSYSDDDERRDEHRSAVTGLTTRMSSWWGNVFPANTPVDEDDPQAVTDDYLTFLDRRYHRLHDEDEPAPAPIKPFSAWDWLMDKDSKINEAIPDPEGSHEDALFVLGVAELASDRLLQKHLHHKATTSQPIIETKATTLSPKTSGLFGAPSNSRPSVSVLKRVKQRRRALIAYQEKQLKRAAIASVKAAALAPLGIVKAAEAVWRYGGGKKTFALTLGVLTGLFLLMRPAMAAVVSMIVE